MMNTSAQLATDLGFCYHTSLDSSRTQRRVSDLTSEDIRRALGGDDATLKHLVHELTPVIQGRVARALFRRQGLARGRDVRQEVEDLTQEVFVALFDNEGKALRGWDPERGLSLKNYVGLIAGQRVIDIMRVGRRNPWKEDPTLAESMERSRSGQGNLEQQVASKELLLQLLDRLRSELSPLGLQIFNLLLVQQRTIKDVCSELNMTPDAVYAWRSRLRKLAGKLAAALETENLRSLEEAAS